MPDQPPVPPTTQDFPDHWGFYLLQAINRLEDEQRHTADTLRQEISSVRQEMALGLTSVRQDVDNVRREMDQKLDGLRYWYWGTLVVIIIGIVTLLVAHP